MPRNPFTPANARAMAALSIAARRAKRDRKAKAAAEALLHPPSFALPPGSMPSHATPLADQFRGERLNRVRAILERIDRKAKLEDDPQALSWLATAAARWSEQEFDLSDRPRPGQKRPAADRSAKAGVFWGSAAPLPPTVQPLPVTRRSLESPAADGHEGPEVPTAEEALDPNQASPPPEE